MLFKQFTIRNQTESILCILMFVNSRYVDIAEA